MEIRSFQKQARKAVKFTNDTTGPELIMFDLNMTSNILTLYFSETVEVDSFDATQITFLNNNSNAQLWKLLYEGKVLSNDSTEVMLEIDNRDLNEIKIRELLATDQTNTFLSVTAQLVDDMNTNDLIPIEINDPLRVSNFMQDRVRPYLTNFVLDMDGPGILHLTFSETVNITSLDVTQITLASAKNFEADEFAEKYVIGSLGPGSFSNSTDGPEIDIQLHFDDINELKILTQLATTKSTTFLSINQTMIEDMNGNLVLDIQLTNSKDAGDYIHDLTPPELEKFSLDLNTGILNLTFSEPVFGDRLNRTFIRFHNSSDGTGSYFQLHIGSTDG